MEDTDILQSILDTSLRLNNEVRKLSELQNLVLVAKKGDKDAFAQLYQHIYKDLYKFAYYVLKNDQDAQDAVSDAVMDAYAGISKLKNADAFRSWMFKILSAKCKRKLENLCGAESGKRFGRCRAVGKRLRRIAGAETGTQHFERRGAY